MVRRSTKKEPKVETLEAIPMQTVSVKLKAQSDYGKEGIEVMVSKQMEAKEDAGEMIDELIALIQDKIDEYMEGDESDDSEYEKDSEEEEEDESEDVEDGADDESDDDFEEDDDSEEEDEELTEDDVRKMKKKDLVELIDEYDLEIDPKDYKKIGELREAVIAALFEDDDSDGDDDADDDSSDGDDWDDDDWDDDE